MIDILSADFLIALLQIIAIDILLGGDNAVVIALACRRLPPDKRRQGILWGVAGAIGLRIGLIFFALQLLAVPWLKVAGALLLFWIGVKLLQPEDGEHGEVAAPATLAGAIKTIVVADAVMSLDNVIAVAGAANGSLVLVVFGILVSIPIVVWGSQFVLKMMDRFPIVIIGGGALLGWIGGGMIVSDPALPLDLLAAVPYAKYLASVLGAIFVIATGRLLVQRSRRVAERPGEGLAEPASETA